MEHILNSQAEGIDFARYSAYIASIQHRLPPHVFSFASDSRYFDLSSHSSLHDAWLEALVVREVATGGPREARRTEVSLCFLGPFHDRRIHLHYTGVRRYSFVTPPQKPEGGDEPGAHGDLFAHEIRLGHDGLLIHEFLFVNDATFLIECSDLRHSEGYLPHES